MDGMSGLEPKGEMAEAGATMFTHGTSETPAEHLRRASRRHDKGRVPPPITVLASTRAHACAPLFSNGNAHPGRGSFSTPGYLRPHGRREREMLDPQRDEPARNRTKPAQTLRSDPIRYQPLAIDAVR